MTSSAADKINFYMFARKNKSMSINRDGFFHS